jgi:hypothetical protein
VFEYTLLCALNLLNSVGIYRTTGRGVWFISITFFKHSVLPAYMVMLHCSRRKLLLCTVCGGMRYIGRCDKNVLTNLCMLSIDDNSNRQPMHLFPLGFAHLFFQNQNQLATCVRACVISTSCMHVPTQRNHRASLTICKTVFYSLNK